MMKTSMAICLALLATGGVISPSAAQAQAQGQRCIVDLPQPPANVHRWPRGPLIDRLTNGDVVMIHDLVLDAQGYLWADISNANVGPAWIFRQHVKCE
jgi:hypothetical protein